jgi:hypothetical protein
MRSTKANRSLTVAAPFEHPFAYPSRDRQGAVL